MRRHSIAFAVGFLSLWPAGPAFAAAVSAADAPKADGRLLRALDRGDEEIRVIVGLKDGTPPARALLAKPDPEGEPERRVRRLAAQKSLAKDMPLERFRTRHFYESFSMVAGTVSRQGAIELANRPDVDWLTVDGVNRLLQTTPQSGQLLIRSDQTNTLGYNGAGQTIAVIDTGIDYAIGFFGGGSFPNAKVIGGIDIADRTNDPKDCEGHGTSVAAIIAGPTGVAPGARIVALKVFSTQGSTCRTEALNSDILQAINYAITNRTNFGITAINLSLGSAFDDNQDHGYCDQTEVAYAAAIDSATAAGIVVVAASGNSGLTNSIAAPACLSSAVSVGAVYSDNYGRVTWLDDNGNIFCVDPSATPDKISCFSGSASTLSLLGPGAFWSVVTKGGGTDPNFAGTSASAPAVAGAVALLRQARPNLTPGAVTGILRATGKPITDTRNGVVTARIDTLAAVQLAPSSFSSYAGPPVAIPDGTDSATVTVTISGFTAPLAGVQAWVEIDHPEPAQLRLTLIGPDGTSAVLHDRTGRSQRPINAIYGKTDTPAQFLSVFQRKQANGVWMLKVEDQVVGTIGRIRNFAVTLIPGQPTACTPGPTTLCLNNGRFQVQVAWQVVSQGTNGLGQALSLTGDSGYFWFFSNNNVELVVKVVDGRPVNGKFWVFYGALSDVQYAITVTDTLTGAVKTYPNPQGRLASVADVNAF